MEDHKMEALEDFGKKFVQKSRDFTIQEELKIIEGSAKSPTSIKLHEKLNGFSPEQIETVKDIIIDTVDGALNNFLWLLEQEDQIDLVSFQDGKSVSLKEISDGLSVDYWNFVDKFSKYKRID